MAKAIADFEGDGSAALDRLMAIRRRKSVRLRELVVLALAKHGRQSADVRKALFSMTDDRSARVRAALARALGQWKHDEQAVAEVKKLERDRYSQVRKAAAAALAEQK